MPADSPDKLLRLCARCEVAPKHVTPSGHTRPYCLPCRRILEREHQAKNADRSCARCGAEPRIKGKSYCEACNRLNKAESAERTANLPCVKCGAARAPNQTHCLNCARDRNLQSHEANADVPCSKCHEGIREPNTSWCVPCNRAALQALRATYGYCGKDAERGRETNRRAGHRRRARRRHLTEIRVDPWPTTCGRCGCEIDPTERHVRYWKNPLAESVGHEPPLKWAFDNGLIWVDVRPEHWRCNNWEQAVPDHLRPPVPAEFHVEHGCSVAS